MFSIGEFSKITGLTIKTLRFYHERGVLIPAQVEAGSGYRYYDQRNIDVARTITGLRDFGFSLDDVIEILRNHNDEADILKHLEKQKLLLRDRMARDRATVSNIDQIIQKETEARNMIKQPTFEIEVKELTPLLVAGIRITGRYEDCSRVFGKLGRTLGRHIAGLPLCLYYDQEYRKDDADFEPCLPVRKMIKAEGADVRKLKGGTAITLVHQGPYTELGRSYERLIQHAKDRGSKVLMPSREVYLKGPGMIFKGNPKKYLTEIQMMIDADCDGAKATDRA